MKPEREGLDEMQRSIRDRIGNQSFFLLFYLLMLDAGLSGLGFRWLSYPANVMVILMVVMGVNLVRLILKNSYLGPSAKNRSVAGFLVAAAIGFALALVVLLSDLGRLFDANSPSVGDNSAMILFIVSAVVLIIALIVLFIKKRQNKNDE